MNNISKKYSENKNIDQIINDYDQIIYDDKNWIAGELWKIAEVTFSYTKIDLITNKPLTLNGKNININTTLLVNIGGLDLDNFVNLEDSQKEKELLKARKVIIIKLENKKKLIKKATLRIKRFKNKFLNEIEKNKKSIFLNSLKEKKLLLNYCLNGLNYELEKAGIKIISTNDEEKNINLKQEKLDRLIFSGNIKDKPKEVEICYNHIKNMFLEKRNILSKEDILTYESYLDKIKNYLPKNYVFKKKEKLVNHITELDEYKMPSDDYLLIFNLFAEVYGELNHTIIKSNTAKSISDGPLGVQIPNTQEFEKMDISQILRLSEHEITTHSVTDYNNRIIIGNTRGEGSIEKDEGLAILMEQLLKYGNQIYKTSKSGKIIIDINKLEIPESFIKTLMGEILNNEHFKEFLEIHNKMYKDNIGVDNRIDRLKRLNSLGVQHKDTSYTRGLFKAVKEINKFIEFNGKKGINFYDLFLGKISFKETYKLKNIKVQNNIKTLNPNFVVDFVYYSLINKINNKKTTINEFLEFIEKKYSIIQINKKEIEEDINYNYKLINGIISLFIKNIDNKELATSKFHIKSSIKNIITNTNVLVAKNRLSKERKDAIKKST